MKLVDSKSGKWTKILNDEFGFVDIRGAINRLIKREFPGHFGWQTNLVREDFLTDGYEFKIEVARSVGDMTEHTGKFVWFKVEG